MFNQCNKWNRKFHNGGSEKDFLEILNEQVSAMFTGAKGGLDNSETGITIVFSINMEMITLQYSGIEIDDYLHQKEYL